MILFDVYLLLHNYTSNLIWNGQTSVTPAVNMIKGDGVYARDLLIDQVVARSAYLHAETQSLLPGTN